MTPIPLGILASSADFGFVPIEAYDFLVGSDPGGSAEFVFNNLSVYATDYDHLEIRATLRLNSSFHDSIRARFNYTSISGQGTTDYDLTGFWFNGSNRYGQANNMDMEMITLINTIHGNNNDGVGTTKILILDAFNTNKKKTLKFKNAITGNTDRIEMSTGFWNSLSAINSIHFRTNSLQNWDSKSRFSLYGIKEG